MQSKPIVGLAGCVSSGGRSRTFEFDPAHDRSGVDRRGADTRRASGGIAGLGGCLDTLVHELRARRVPGSYGAAARSMQEFSANPSVLPIQLERK